MKPWTEDAIQQLAVAAILNQSGISPGERLALIICDNAVEFMLIAYTEMEKHLIGSRITRANWEKTKQNFEPLLDFAVSQESSLRALRDDILSFHKVRNTLYHTGQPLAVKAAHVDRYIELARETSEILLGGRLSSDEWDAQLAHVNRALVAQSARAIKVTVAVEVVGEAVRVRTPVRLGNLETICLVLDAFTREMGGPPTYDQLERSLALSGAPHLSGSNLAKRIHDCRTKRLVHRDSLAITVRGHNFVVSKVAV